jgi:hypothetical protein
LLWVHANIHEILKTLERSPATVVLCKPKKSLIQTGSSLLRAGCPGWLAGWLVSGSLGQGPGIYPATYMHYLVFIMSQIFSLFHHLQEGADPDPESEDPNRLPPDRDVLGAEQTSPSFVSTAWLVFKTFFASLLPEGPPAIAN